MTSGEARGVVAAVVARAVEAAVDDTTVGAYAATKEPEQRALMALRWGLLGLTPNNEANARRWAWLPLNVREHALDLLPSFLNHETRDARDSLAFALRTLGSLAIPFGRSRER